MKNNSITLTQKDLSKFIYNQLEFEKNFIKNLKKLEISQNNKKSLMNILLKNDTKFFYSIFEYVYNHYDLTDKEKLQFIDYFNEVGLDTFNFKITDQIALDYYKKNSVLPKKHSFSFEFLKNLDFQTVSEANIHLKYFLNYAISALEIKKLKQIDPSITVYDYNFLQNIKYWNDAEFRKYFKKKWLEKMKNEEEKDFSHFHFKFYDFQKSDKKFLQAILQKNNYKKIKYQEMSSTLKNLDKYISPLDYFVKFNYQDLSQIKINKKNLLLIQKNIEQRFIHYVQTKKDFYLINLVYFFREFLFKDFEQFKKIFSYKFLYEMLEKQIKNKYQFSTDDQFWLNTYKNNLLFEPMKAYLNDFWSHYLIDHYQKGDYSITEQAFFLIYAKPNKKIKDFFLKDFFHQENIENVQNIFFNFFNKNYIEYMVHSKNYLYIFKNNPTKEKKIIIQNIIDNLKFDKGSLYFELSSQIVQKFKNILKSYPQYEVTIINTNQEEAKNNIKALQSSSILQNLEPETQDFNNLFFYKFRTIDCLLEDLEDNHHLNLIRNIFVKNKRIIPVFKEQDLLNFSKNTNNHHIDILCQIYDKINQFSDLPKIPFYEILKIFDFSSEKSSQELKNLFIKYDYNFLIAKIVHKKNNNDTYNIVLNHNCSINISLQDFYQIWNNLEQEQWTFYDSVPLLYSLLSQDTQNYSKLLNLAQKDHNFLYLVLFSNSCINYHKKSKSNLNDPSENYFFVYENIDLMTFKHVLQKLPYGNYFYNEIISDFFKSLNYQYQRSYNTEILNFEEIIIDLFFDCEHHYYKSMVFRKNFNGIKPIQKILDYHLKNSKQHLLISNFLCSCDTSLNEFIDIDEQFYEWLEKEVTEFILTHNQYDFAEKLLNIIYEQKLSETFSSYTQTNFLSKILITSDFEHNLKHIVERNMLLNSVSASKKSAVHKI